MLCKDLNRAKEWTASREGSHLKKQQSPAQKRRFEAPPGPETPAQKLFPAPTPSAEARAEECLRGVKEMVGRWCCGLGKPCAPSNPAQRPPRPAWAPGPGLPFPAHPVTPHPEPPAQPCTSPPPPILVPPGLPARTATLQLARPRLTAVRSGSRSRIPTGRAPRPAAQACPAPPPAGRGLSMSPPPPQPAGRPPLGRRCHGNRALTLCACPARAAPRPTQTAGAFLRECREPRGGVRLGGAGSGLGRRGLSGREVARPKGAAEEQARSGGGRSGAWLKGERRGLLRGGGAGREGAGLAAKGRGSAEWVVFGRSFILVG